MGPLLLLSTACSSPLTPAQGPALPTATSPTETAAPDTAPTADTTHTGDTGDTHTGDTDTDTDTGPPPPFDCESVPAGPRAFAALAGLYASEDFAFDGVYLISHYGTALFRQTYPPGTVEAFAVTAGGSGGPASLRMLATGDLVYANVDTSTLYRVARDGTSTSVYGGLGYPMGIDIHPTGKVFVSDLMGLLRIDPYTGEVDVILEGGVIVANGITFSEDYGTLYFGTMSGIFSMQVDAEGGSLAPPELWAQTPPGEVLGMGVDLCGSVYALWQGVQLLRFAGAMADPEVLMEAPPGAWMTNIQWGSGTGGWDELALYVTDRSLTSPAYYEVQVAVPSKVYP